MSSTAIPSYRLVGMIWTVSLLCWSKLGIASLCWSSTWEWWWTKRCRRSRMPQRPFRSLQPESCSFPSLTASQDEGLMQQDARARESERCATWKPPQKFRSPSDLGSQPSHPTASATHRLNTAQTARWIVKLTGTHSTAWHCIHDDSACASVRSSTLSAPGFLPKNPTHLFLALASLIPISACTLFSSASNPTLHRRVCCPGCRG